MDFLAFHLIRKLRIIHGRTHMGRVVTDGRPMEPELGLTAATDLRYLSGFCKQIWGTRKDSNLHVSAFVAQCPVQLNDARIAKWLRDQGSNLEPAGSEPADLPIDLSRNGGEARNRTENRWNQNPLLCQLSYLPTNLPPNKQWGDRWESNPRGMFHRHPPEPLGYGHNWCLESESSRPLQRFRLPLIHLSYPGELGGSCGAPTHTLLGANEAL